MPPSARTLLSRLPETTSRSPDNVNIAVLVGVDQANVGRGIGGPLIDLEGLEAAITAFVRNPTSVGLLSEHSTCDRSSEGERADDIADHVLETGVSGLLVAA